MPTKPTPPPGYEVQNLPSFIQSANADTKIVSAPGLSDKGRPLIAGVDPNNPHTINVGVPQSFTQPVQTHESTHVYQMSRNPDFVDTALNAKSIAGKSWDNASGYGGIAGLEQATKDRKTIAHFNAEQQSEMVADYQRLTADALKRQDAKALSRVTAAYHPFVSQLASIPPKGADMTKMTKQDLSPVAPSVPPATVAGMPLTPDPLLGGEGKIVGTKKTFGNGKMGRWDGHGWVHQQ